MSAQGISLQANTTNPSLPPANSNPFTKAYQAWFNVNQRLVDALRGRGYVALSAIVGMVNLEVHTLVRAIWFRLVKYRKAPEAYGFNPSAPKKPPVLLFHGAVGEWNYLGDLAKELSKTRSVYVLNLSPSLSQEKQQALISEKLLSIRNLYPRDAATAVKIDLVAHSMGGSTAFNALFNTSDSAKPLIGKLITIALPLDSNEINRAQEIGKDHDVYSILAQYDALMGYKHSGISLENHQRELDAGHVGIVYHKALGSTVESILNQPSSHS